MYQKIQKKSVLKIEMNRSKKSSIMVGVIGNDVSNDI